MAGKLQFELPVDAASSRESALWAHFANIRRGDVSAAVADAELPVSVTSPATNAARGE
jgi:hypothetical protein